MNTERITLMEQRLQRAEKALSALETALEQYTDVHNDITALDAYLGSPEWLADRDDDEAGRLPQDLKRGVLSEDAIWNLIERYRDLKQQMHETNHDGSFRPMRRFKQQMSGEECIALLKRASRGVLAVLGDGGYPYGLPINHYYCEEDGRLYFHSGMRGHKVDALRRCDRASFCVIDEGRRREGDWALTLRSVIVFGRVFPVEDPEKAMEIARALSLKFTSDEDYIRREIEGAGPATLVFALRPEHISGKQVREA